MADADKTIDAGASGADSGPQGEDVPSVELDVARERARQALFGQRQTSRKVGRFTLLEPVGRGGMGTVYAAYDPQLDRRIAVKLLSVRRKSRDRSTSRRRMLAEARAMAKISHPNVVTVYEVGVVDDDDDDVPSVFVAMEFVAGKTLREWVTEDKPDWRQIVEAYAAAGRGLAAVHAAGLVHRDFKPDNVMRNDEDGRVQVMDFGLARDDGLSTSGSTDPSAVATVVGQLTKTGVVLGTPAYMAPEQFRGEVADALADQYAYCVSLYEALWGHRPHVARTARELVAKVVGRQEAPPPPRGPVPNRIRRAVARGLLKDRARRWPSMAALLTELRPPSGQRRVVVGALGLAFVGALAWANTAARPPAPCGGGAEALAPAWNDQHRAQVVAALNATALGTSGATRVADRLGAYGQRWIAQHEDACTATQIRGEQSEARMDQRMACLGRRRAELRALVDVLSEGDPTVALKADHAVDALTSPLRCGDPAFLDATVEPPSDPAVAARVDELRDQIAHATALRDTGASQQALTLLEDISAQAQQIDYAPIRIEADAAAAQAAVGLHADFRPALARVESAYFDAREHGLPLVAASAAAQVAAMLGTADSDFDGAAHWLRLAQAEVRSHGLTDLDTTLAETEAALAEHDGRYQEAIDILLDSVATQRQACGDDCPAMGDMLESLAGLYDELNDHDASLEYAQQALAYERGRHGDDHPHLALPLLRLGQAQAQLGRHAEAIGNLQRAVQLRERELGPKHVNVLTARAVLAAALVDADRLAEGLAVLERAVALAREAQVPAIAANLLNRLASAYGDDGRIEEARAAYQEAAQVMKQTHPGPHPAHGTLRSNIAHTFVLEGKHEEALAGFRDALKLHEAMGHPPDATTAPYLINIGKELAALHRPSEAVGPLQRASQLLASHSISPRVVELELSLARARAASDRAAGRATVEALLARCKAQSAVHQRAATCDRIPAWRAEHDL